MRCDCGIRSRAVQAHNVGLTRFSFHLYTTEADVDRALEAMAGG